ncbi:unnamed protein product, partial [Leptidea sinapis]
MEVLAYHGLFLGHNFPTHDRTCLDHLNLKSHLPIKILVVESTVTDNFAIVAAISLKKKISHYRTSIIKIAFEKLEFQKAGNNSKQVWKTIQSITNSGKTKSPAENLLCLKENRQLSVHEVNSYYANIGRQLVDKIHNSAFAARSHTSILCPNSFVLFSTDESEVERVVTSLKNNSAMGWDGIST